MSSVKLDGVVNEPKSKLPPDATDPGTQLVPFHTNACPDVGVAVTVSTSTSALMLDVV
jgi:hypothetical protein